MVFQGCEKEEITSIANPAKKNSTNIIDKSNESMLTNENDTTIIADEEFETEFDSFAIPFFNNHPEGIILNEYNSEESIHIITTDEDGESNQNNEIMIYRDNSLAGAQRCSLMVENNLLIGYIGCDPWILVRHTFGDLIVYETHVDC